MREGRSASSRLFGLATCALLSAALACETVVVSTVDVAEVQGVPPSMTVVEGESETATAFVRESGGAELSGVAVAWSVDDARIATVTPEGVVQGLAPGTTRIRAWSEGVSGSAEVTVVRIQGPEPRNPCELRDQTFTGNFAVPKNARCILTNVRVGGRLQLGEGSSLVASELTVDEDLEARDAAELVLTASTIRGELRFERGATVTVRNSSIGRKVEIKGNRGAITVADNTIAEALKLEDNRLGPFSLLRNSSEKLECKENDPVPTGGGNVVEDQKTGQCVGL